MPGYVTFTTTRTTVPDPVALLAAVKTATGDASAALSRRPDGTWLGKQVDDWTPAEVSAVQTILDTVAALTPQVIAQRDIDTWPIEFKALALALIDQLNVIRAALPVPLGAITPAQAITAIRNKAGTL